MALVDDLDNVIELISYEGSFTATDGPANGMTSTDIGVSESNSTPVGTSLQLTGSGYKKEDFTWVGGLPETAGTVNQQQSLGKNSVILTVTDVNGNVSTCTATVTVEDTVSPVITCPGNINQTADAGQCGAVVNFEATATDNCSATITYSQDPGTFFPVGITTIIATATDPSGNEISCSFDITVTDDENPTITCAPDQTQTADPGQCDAAVTVAGPTTSDNCGVATVVNDYNGTADASDTYPVGTTTVTWTVTDIHGNTKPVLRISR